MDASRDVLSGYRLGGCTDVRARAGLVSARLNGLGIQARRTLT